MVLFFSRDDLKDECREVLATDVIKEHLDDKAATILSFTCIHKPETKAFFVEPGTYTTNEVFPIN